MSVVTAAAPASGTGTGAIGIRTGTPLLITMPSLLALHCVFECLLLVHICSCTPLVRIRFVAPPVFHAPPPPGIGKFDPCASIEDRYTVGGIRRMRAVFEDRCATAFFAIAGPLFAASLSARESSSFVGWGIDIGPSFFAPLCILYIGCNIQGSA
jgi:hypothetical protein